MKSKSFKDNQGPKDIISLFPKPPKKPNKPNKFGKVSLQSIWHSMNQFLIRLFLRVSSYYLEQIEEKKIVLIPSAMQKRFTLWVEAVFRTYFNKNPMESKDIERIHSYFEKGTIVYVLYCRSKLDYLYFNFLYRRLGLPLANFANGVDLLWLLSVKKVFNTLIARVFYRWKKGQIQDPLNENIPQELVKEKEPILLFLTRSKSVFTTNFGFEKDPFLDLVRLQNKIDFPIYVVPQLLIAQKGPETLKERTFLDVIFGNPDQPGYIRKFINFLRYSRRYRVKVGEAINIQEFLRKDTGSLKIDEKAKRIRWVLRHYLYRERKAVLGPQQRDRQRIMNRISRHVELQTAIEKWSERTGKSFDEGGVLAQKYIHELVPGRRWAMIVFLDRFLYVIWKAFFGGVVTDSEQCERVRDASKDYPIVFVPNHRSHFDYLVVSSVLYRSHLVQPFICAGINLAFWPLGPIFRAAGAYFIRRSYPEPDIYPVVLDRYIRELSNAGQAHMFFIEGGRSRTGKLLQPKLGILSKVLDSYRKGIAKDVVIIPVSVGYDRIMEEKSYTDEAKGEEKKKEDIGTLLQFFQKLFRSRFGKIYVHFGDGISISKYLKEHDGDQVLKQISGRINYGINRVSVVYPTAFVATILLSHRKRSLSLLEIRERSETLIRYLERRKVRFSEVFDNAQYAIDSALDRLSNAKLIRRFQEDKAVFYTVDDSKRLALNYYKNNVIHFFTTFSFLATSLLSAQRKSGENQSFHVFEVEKNYNFLKSVFDWEFYFRPKESQPAFVKDVLQFFEDEGLLKVEKDQVHLSSIGAKKLKSHQEICFNFLETYYLLFSALENLRGRFIDEKDFLKRTLDLGKKFYVQGRIERQESLSKFTLQNGLRSLSEKGFLKRTERKGQYEIKDDANLFKEWSGPLKQLLRQEMVD